MSFSVMNFDASFCRLQAYARAVSVIRSRDEEGESEMSAGEVEILEAAMHAGYEQFLEWAQKCLRLRCRIFGCADLPKLSWGRSRDLRFRKTGATLHFWHTADPRGEECSPKMDAFFRLWTLICTCSVRRAGAVDQSRHV
jgi:hypothetical protein